MLQFNDTVAPDCVVVFSVADDARTFVAAVQEYMQQILDTVNIRAKISETHSIDMVAAATRVDHISQVSTTPEERSALDSKTATVADLNQTRKGHGIPPISVDNRVWVALHMVETRQSPLDAATWDGLVVSDEARAQVQPHDVMFNPAKIAECMRSGTVPMPEWVLNVGISGVSVDFMISAWKNIIGEGPIGSTPFGECGAGFMAHRMHRSTCTGWVEMAEQSLNYNWPHYP